MPRTDLHARLVEAATAHLTLAEALVGIGDYDAVISGPRAQDLADHLAANDPAHVIRACRADLERLQRHMPASKHGPESPYCAYEWGDGDGYLEPWPCPETRLIAGVYQVEVDG